MMLRRLKIVSICALLFFAMVVMFASTKREEVEFDGQLDEVALAQFVPAVSAHAVETGTCVMAHRLTGGSGIVQISFPAAPGEDHGAVISLDSLGVVTGYSEERRTAAATTSLMIEVSQGTASATNVTENGSRMTVGRGTVDEALQSEVLGVPARRIESILARCGRPR
jgi:hypothetical protein